MCIVGSQLSKVERETEVKKLSTQQIIIDKELLEEETMDDIACRMPIQSVADGPGRDPLEPYTGKATERGPHAASKTRNHGPTLKTNTAAF